MTLVARCVVCDAKLPNQYGGGVCCGGNRCANVHEHYAVKRNGAIRCRDCGAYFVILASGCRWVPSTRKKRKAA